MVLNEFECVVSACRRRTFPAKRLVRYLQRLPQYDNSGLKQMFNDGALFEVVTKSNSEPEACHMFCDQWVHTRNNNTFAWILIAARCNYMSSFADFLEKELKKLINEKTRQEIGDILTLVSAEMAQVKLLHSAAFHMNTLPDQQLTKNYFEQREHELGVFEAVFEACKHPNQELVVLFGDGGVGKTTMLCRLLNDGEKQQQLKAECKTDTVVWINCFDFQRKEDFFDNAKFTKKILEAIAEIQDVTQNSASADASAGQLRDFKTLPSVVNFFKQHERQILFVLDDVFDPRLLQYFQRILSQQRWGACCVLTRDVQMIKDCANLVVKRQLKLTPIESMELMLKRTLSLGKYLNDEQIKILAERCCGLPLVASLIAAQFDEDSDTETTYTTLINRTTLGASLPVVDSDRYLTATGNDAGSRFAVQNVCQLLQISFDQLGQNDSKRYYCFLFFNPAELVRVEQIALLWSCDVGEATLYCKQLEKRCLLRSSGSAIFFVHQMLHEAALGSACSLFNANSLQEFQYKIIAADVVPNNASSPVSIIVEAIRRKDRSLINMAVDKLKPKQLAELFATVSNVPNGRNLCHHLYWVQWPDDVRNATSPRFGTNNSYRIIAKLLHKIRAAEIDVSDLIYNKGDQISLAKDLLADLHSEQFSEDRGKIFTILSTLLTCFDRQNERTGANSGAVSELHDAIVEGDLARIQTLMLSNIEIANNYEQVHQSRSPLMAAVLLGHGDLVKWLCEQFPAKLTSVDHINNTVLMLAAIKGDLHIFDYLFRQVERQAAQLTAQNNEGFNVLLLASAAGNIRIISYLVDSLNDDSVRLLFHSVNNAGETCLHEAAASGHLNVVKFIVQATNRIVLEIDLIELADDSGRTPLFRAAFEGHHSIVEFICEYSTESINKPNKLGNTPLSAAAMANHADVVELLFRNGSDLFYQDVKGKTAIMFAAANGFLAVVRSLCECADAQFSNGSEKLLKMKDFDAGHSAIQLARREAHSNVVNYLLAHNIPVCMLHLLEDDKALSSSSSIGVIIRTGIDSREMNEQKRREAVTWLLNFIDEASLKWEASPTSYPPALLMNSLEAMSTVLSSENGANSIELRKAGGTEAAINILKRFRGIFSKFSIHHKGNAKYRLHTIEQYILIVILNLITSSNEMINHERVTELFCLLSQLSADIVNGKLAIKAIKLENDSSNVRIAALILAHIASRYSLTLQSTTIGIISRLLNNLVEEESVKYGTALLLTSGPCLDYRWRYYEALLINENAPVHVWCVGLVNLIATFPSENAMSLINFADIHKDGAIVALQRLDPNKQTGASEAIKAFFALLRSRFIDMHQQFAARIELGLRKAVDHIKT